MARTKKPAAEAAPEVVEAPELEQAPEPEITAQVGGWGLTAEGGWVVLPTTESTV